MTPCVHYSREHLTKPNVVGIGCITSTCQKLNFSASWTMRGLELTPMMRPKSPGVRTRPVMRSTLPPNWNPTLGGDVYDQGHSDAGIYVRREFSVHQGNTAPVVT